MSRDVKRQIIWYTTIDGEATARHLERMAAKGWHLEKAGNWLWTYRRGESGAVRYAVTYFPEASVFDAAPTEGQETYIDYCAAAGWELAAVNGPVQYFRSTRPAPVPIETDEAQKLRSIHRTMRKTQVFSYGMLIAVLLLGIWGQVMDFRNRPLTKISDPRELVMFASSVCATCYFAASLAGYLVWYLRSKRSVARGGRCVRVHAGLQAAGSIFILALLALFGIAYLLLNPSPGELKFRLLYFVGLLLVVLLCQVMLKALKLDKHSRKEVRGRYIAGVVLLSFAFTLLMSYFTINVLDELEPAREPASLYTSGRGWTWEIYQDELPVTLEDLGFTVTPEDHASYEAETSRTPLASYAKYEQSLPGQEDPYPLLSCQVCIIRWAWLREASWKDVLRPITYRSYYREPYPVVLEPPVEEVLEARREEDASRYALLCADRVITIYARWNLTAEQLQTIVRALQ